MKVKNQMTIREHMTSAVDPIHIRALVVLAFEIAELRLKLAGAESRVMERHLSGKTNGGGEELIEAAHASSLDLVAMRNSILRRMADTAGVEATLARPLNAFEEAHLDLARRNAQAIDAWCADQSK